MRGRTRLAVEEARRDVSAKLRADPLLTARVSELARRLVDIEVALARAIQPNHQPCCGAVFVDTGSHQRPMVVCGEGTWMRHVCSACRQTHHEAYDALFSARRSLTRQRRRILRGLLNLLTGEPP